MEKNETVTTIADIKAAYPDEWVLLGDPMIETTSVQSGVVLYHSKDYLEVCYKGSEFLERLRTIIFTGQPKQTAKAKWWRLVRLKE